MLFEHNVLCGTGGVLMTKILSSVLVLFFSMCIFSNVAYAYEVRNQMPWKNVQKALRLMEGNWYDDDGKLVLTIKGDYINSCEVMAAFDFAGSSNFAAGLFRIHEGGGMRLIKIRWQIFSEKSDYIILDNDVMLHRTPDYYYESIGGVHLGMSSDNVRNILGTCSREEKNVQGSYNWYYDNVGLEISFDGNCTTSITILKSCKLRLDRSGLNSTDTPKAFAEFYNWKPKSNGKFILEESPHKIEYGEFIWLGKNMKDVVLTVYWN